MDGTIEGCTNVTRKRFCLGFGPSVCGEGNVSDPFGDVVWVVLFRATVGACSDVTSASSYSVFPRALVPLSGPVKL